MTRLNYEHIGPTLSFVLSGITIGLYIAAAAEWMIVSSLMMLALLSFASWISIVSKSESSTHDASLDLETVGDTAPILDSARIIPFSTGPTIADSEDNRSSQTVA